MLAWPKTLYQLIPYFFQAGDLVFPFLVFGFFFSLLTLGLAVYLGLELCFVDQAGFELTEICLPLPHVLGCTTIPNLILFTVLSSKDHSTLSRHQALQKVPLSLWLLFPW